MNDLIKNLKEKGIPVEEMEIPAIELSAESLRWLKEYNKMRELGQKNDSDLLIK